MAESASNLTLPSWVSHTQGPPHSITAAPWFSLYFLNKVKKNNSSKLRWKLIQSETTLMSSLQSAYLTATIVWARFSYCCLTAVSGMLHVDNRLPFCCNLQQIATQRVKPLLVSERHNKLLYHQAEVVDDVWTLLLCAVMLARYVCHQWSTQLSAVEHGDLATRIGTFCDTYRAGHAMNKLRQLMSEHSFCVSDTQNIRFSPPVGTVVDFTSILFTNSFLTMQMDRPTNIEMEMERKLFIDHYCK